MKSFGEDAIEDPKAAGLLALATRARVGIVANRTIG
jgi:hypothetical protein